jgi:hypothetical protein
LTHEKDLKKLKKNYFYVRLKEKNQGKSQEKETSIYRATGYTYSDS